MSKVEWSVIVALLALIFGLVTAFKYVYADPDKNNVSIVCLFGHEYVFFSRAYRAGLAVRFADDGKPMVCDD